MTYVVCSQHNLNILHSFQKVYLYNSKPEAKEILSNT